VAGDDGSDVDGLVGSVVGEVVGDDGSYCETVM
jgi:hypothetical protein